MYRSFLFFFTLIFCFGIGHNSSYGQASSSVCTGMGSTCITCCDNWARTSCSAAASSGTNCVNWQGQPDPSCVERFTQTCIASAPWQALIANCKTQCGAGAGMVGDSFGSGDGMVGDSLGAGDVGALED